MGAGGYMEGLSMVDIVLDKTAKILSDLFHGVWHFKPFNIASTLLESGLIKV